MGLSSLPNISFATFSPFSQCLASVAFWSGYMDQNPLQGLCIIVVLLSKTFFSPIGQNMEVFRSQFKWQLFRKKGLN